MKRHRCEPEWDAPVAAGRIFPSDAYGPAIGLCEENEAGELWCGSGEYETRVNYCPFCGYAAPQMVEWKPSKGETR